LTGKRARNRPGQQTGQQQSRRNGGRDNGGTQAGRLTHLGCAKRNGSRLATPQSVDAPQRLQPATRGRFSFLPRPRRRHRNIIRAFASRPYRCIVGGDVQSLQPYLRALRRFATLLGRPCDAPIANVRNVKSTFGAGSATPTPRGYVMTTKDNLPATTPTSNELVQSFQGRDTW